MKEYFTFDDVLILPKFSEVSSRKDVDLSISLSDTVNLRLPIISSNMDTISGANMCIKLGNLGGLGILHRFWTIQDNVAALRECYNSYINRFHVGVSIGLGDGEKERLEALYEAGARVFCIDVAHGAQQSVIQQALEVKSKENTTLIVGNFATLEAIKEFESRAGKDVVDCYKVGIGGGSVCSTRLKTGVGFPQLSAIQETAKSGLNIIADGGIRHPGDAAKALAAGATAVMIGGLLAGTDETPGDIIYESYHDYQDFESKERFKIGCGKKMKKYRGSASQESYKDQGKESEWRGAEGVSLLVDYKGPVQTVIQELENGIRSSLTYTGSKNLREFRRNAEFIRVSGSTKLENQPHKTFDSGSK